MGFKVEGLRFRVQGLGFGGWGKECMVWVSSCCNGGKRSGEVSWRGQQLQRTAPNAYRGTSPIRNSAPLGPYSRTMPKALWKP